MIYLCPMIVKILPASRITFEGVKYNENKAEKGKGDLLEAVNFKGLSKKSTKKDFVMYLQTQSKLNTRVKNPQFHAVISAKGNDKSFDELHQFAKHYMNKMGYGKNPYLIYSHKDTKNNHLHIVSSRVDAEGHKINDSFERVRSQEIRNAYLGINTQKEIDKKLRNINSYKIKTVAQYKLLLEKNFSKVIENKNSIDVYQSEMKIEIPKDSIKKRIENSNKYYKTSAIKLRRKELKDLFLKLSEKHSLEGIKVLSKEKNIDIDYFTSKEGKIFGYTVTDRKSKGVFKGSEICPLILLETGQKRNHFEKLITDLQQSQKYSINSLNKKLSSINHSIDSKGFIYNLKDKKNKNPILQISNSILYPLLYQSNVEKIKEKYVVLNESERKMLAMAYKVKKDDITICKDDLKRKKEESNRKNMSSYYNDILLFQKQNSDLNHFLKKEGIHIFKINNEYHFADTKFDFMGKVDLEKEIEDVLDRNDSCKNLSYQEYEKSEIGKQLQESFITGSELANLLSYQDEDSSNTNRQKRRSKKGLKR